MVTRLEAEGRTYRCFCSRRDIREAAAAPHGPSIEGGYPGTCRSLDPSDVAERLAQGRPAATRLRADGAVVTVVDRFHATIEERVDDFVIRRADGVAAYNLAVVVDDADQCVDQVVRGDDLVHTTPRQVLVQRVLGLPTPEYLHVPARPRRRRRATGQAPRGDQSAGQVGGGRVRLRRARTACRIDRPGGPGRGAGRRRGLLDRFDPDRLRIAEQLTS